MNLDAQLRAADAARHLKCPRQRVARWVTLGHLTAIGVDGQGHPLYRLGDLLEAERVTRRSPNSRRPALAAA